jgi:hypothetical protein
MSRIRQRTWCNEGGYEAVWGAVVTVVLIMICWLCGSVPAAVVVGTMLRVRREEMEGAYDYWSFDTTATQMLALSSSRAEAQYWSNADLGPMSELESPRWSTKE